MDEPIKAMIFDFDGTIADTLPIVIKTALDLNNKLKLLPEQDVNVEELRNLSTQDFIARIDMPKYKLLYYVWKFMRIIGSQIEYIKCFPGMEETLQDIHNRGIKLCIVSSNTTKNINKFLKIKNINYFDIVECPFLYVNKAKTLKKVVERVGVSPINVVYVGDETRDIEVARKVGIKVISVTWGYQFRSLLSRFRPDRMVDTPSQLLDLLS